MNIELGDLKAGNYRDVTSQEYDELMRLVKDSSNTTVIHRRDGGDR
jgi:23S rRNA pseudouridine2604 synthase